jgi:hypothetical protein
MSSNIQRSSGVSPFHSSVANALSSRNACRNTSAAYVTGLLTRTSQRHGHLRNQNLAMRYTCRTRIPKRQVVEVACAKRDVRPAIDSGLVQGPANVRIWPGLGEEYAREDTVQWERRRRRCVLVTGSANMRGTVGIVAMLQLRR